jgi:predicted phosphodiesterase
VKVAALYDIHGNLPALESVLFEIASLGLDQVVIGGDVVPGPFPCETVERLLAIDLPVKYIHGNAEIAALDAMGGRNPRGMPESHWPIIRWTAEKTAAFAPLFASWPKTVEIEMGGLGRVIFCHATPRDENEIFTRLTDENRLLPIFEGVNADVVVCGHTHMQFDRRVGSMRVVNAGSVGMPFGNPGACWLLLGPGIELRRTAYDLAAAAERIRASDYPDRENFAARFVLKPPGEQEMLEVFGRAELQSA